MHYLQPNTGADATPFTWANSTADGTPESGTDKPSNIEPILEAFLFTDFFTYGPS